MDHSIFLIESDEEDHFMLELAFGTIGLRDHITFFPSGMALVKELQQISIPEYPHLIGIHCHLPRFSGSNLVEELKHHIQWSIIPLVMFSKSMNQALKDNLMEKGVLACIEKGPFYDDYISLARSLYALTDPDNIHERIS